MSKKAKRREPKNKSLAHQRAARIGVEKRKANGTWTAHQKYARSRLPADVVKRASRKGAQAVIRLYGEQALMKFAREWRIKRPSGPEMALLEILRGLGYVETVRDEEGKYEQGDTTVFIREDQHGSYLLDTYFPALHRAIEVDGKSPLWIDDYRLDFEIRRLKTLEEMGIQILQLRAESLNDQETVNMIKEFLEAPTLAQTQEKPKETTANLYEDEEIPF